MDRSRLILLAFATGALASVVVLAPIGCYSDSWKDGLTADAGDGDADADSDADGDGDCELGEIECTADGVRRCVDGAWQTDRGSTGCEFAAVVLPQDATPGGYSVGLANSGTRTATVVLTQGGSSLGSHSVAPGAAVVVPVTPVSAVVSATASGTAAPATVRIVSDEPIAAFQFNRSDAESASSDGSLLLPRHVWGAEYRAISAPHFVHPSNGDQGSAFWLAAGIDAFDLEADGSATTVAIPGGPFNGGGNGAGAVQASGVAFVVTATGGNGPGSCGWTDTQGLYNCGEPNLGDPSGTFPYACDPVPVEGEACSGTAAFVGCCGPDGALFFCNGNPGVWVSGQCTHAYDQSDLSGSRVTGSEPFAFFAGHDCVTVPAYQAFCDHLEEQLWPESSAGTTFAVAAPNLGGTAYEQVIRITGLSQSADLEYLPAAPVGAPTSVGPGETVVVPVGVHELLLQASAPVSVVQISAGSDALGDPSMLATPHEGQGITEAAFVVPATFTAAVVTVVGAAGTSVTVGGTTTTLSENFPGGRGRARIAIDTEGSAFQRLTASAPVQATVFAQLQYMSAVTTMWFPIGSSEGG